MPILINGVFNLIFNEYNIKKITNIATNDFKNYQKTMLDIKIEMILMI